MTQYLPAMKKFLGELGMCPGLFYMERERVVSTDDDVFSIQFRHFPLREFPSFEIVAEKHFKENNPDNYFRSVTSVRRRT